jgi:hypothetical protein
VCLLDLAMIDLTMVRSRQHDLRTDTIS